MRSLTEIAGLKIEVTADDRKNFLHLVSQALSHAQDIAASRGLNTRMRDMTIALSGAIQSINALLAAGFTKCYLGAPPEDIEVRQKKSGDLVYRCYHDPAHEWDLSGNRLP